MSLPGGDRSPAKSSLADIVIAAACGLSVASTVLALLILPLGHNFAGARDYADYWAAGRQFIRHANPWSASAIGALVRSAGYTGPGTPFMRNPPWALPLTLPLALLSARAAALPWSLLMLAMLALACATLWKALPRPPAPVSWLAYCFPPALISVAMGQIAVLLLFGLVVFLRFYRTRPFVAGAALWFFTLKPHLFLPFGAALVLWIVVERAWRVVLGFVSAFALSCLMTELIDPGAWGDYLRWAGHSGISHEALPCLADAFARLFPPSDHWITFVPCAIASVWAALWFWMRRHTWNWLEGGSLLMLISLLVAPYCWISDQAVALPALLFAVSRGASRIWLAVLGAICLGIEIQVLASLSLHSYWFLWPAPAWLAWYLCARAFLPRSTLQEQPAVS